MADGDEVIEFLTLVGARALAAARGDADYTEGDKFMAEIVVSACAGLTAAALQKVLDVLNENVEPADNDPNDPWNKGFDACAQTVREALDEAMED